MRIILLLLLIIVPACKTTKQAKMTAELKEEFQTDFLYSQLTGLLFTDSVRYKLKQELSGHIRLWSAPNEAGNQFPIADIDFNRKTEEQTEENPFLIFMDSAHISKKEHQQAGENIEIKEQTQKDSRLINVNILSWGIVLFFITALVIGLLKRKN